MHASAPVSAVNTSNHLNGNKPLAIRQPTQHPLRPIHSASLISEEALPPYAFKTPEFKVHRPVESEFIRNEILTHHSTMETRPRMKRSPTAKELNSPLAYEDVHLQEDEEFVPWQEEMRRVEAARFRRQLLELKRMRQQEQRKVEKAREWVWVVDEEMEVQEVPAAEVKVSIGHRVKDVWRKVFNGKRRLSVDELPLPKDKAALRQLTVNF